jgi:cytochrome b subunit of formate dehydrogenase
MSRAHTPAHGAGAPAAGHAAAEGPRYVQRFDRYHRITHGFLMLSFLGLAATGLPLLFSDAGWAWYLSRLFGGFEASGLVHRICAVILMGVFAAHLGRLVQRAVIRKDYTMFWGPTSMVPQPRDLYEMVAHFKYFVGQGPRPKFDHFTYWEKFDYWAVFWGMFVIGGSGLMLWFPEFFSRFVPGWAFNVAMVIHGEEALLAVGFIFTVHFFNGHIRPEKFPMDLVIFTGRMPRHELDEERAGQRERLAAEGRLAAIEAPPPSAGTVTLGRAIGTLAVLIGLSLVVLIVYAVLT